MDYKTITFIEEYAKPYLVACSEHHYCTTVKTKEEALSLNTSDFCVHYECRIKGENNQ